MLYHGRAMKNPLVSVYMQSGTIGKLSSLSLPLINWRSSQKIHASLFPLLSGWLWCSFQEAAQKILQNHTSITHSEAYSRAHPRFGFLHFLFHFSSSSLQYPVNSFQISFFLDRPLLRLCFERNPGQLLWLVSIFLIS